jgi:hypothetical protein
LTILPWVHVPHLASHLLGKMVKLLPQDWQKIYQHPIVFLETFVDTTRFKGTCYRAANWIQVGFTQGRGRGDTAHRHGVPIKAVFVYPLVKGFREVLTHLD